jgi:hypothetical protein
MINSRPRTTSEGSRRRLPGASVRRSARTRYRLARCEAAVPRHARPSTRHRPRCTPRLRSKAAPSRIASCRAPRCNGCTHSNSAAGRPKTAGICRRLVSHTRSQMLQFACEAQECAVFSTLLAPWAISLYTRHKTRSLACTALKRMVDKGRRLRFCPPSNLEHSRDMSSFNR